MAPARAVAQAMVASRTILGLAAVFLTLAAPAQSASTSPATSDSRTASPDSLVRSTPAPGLTSIPSIAIVAYDSTRATWGVAVAAAEIACGSRRIAAIGGVGAVAALGAGSPSLARDALAALEGGRDPEAALTALRGAAADRERLRILLVGQGGRAAVSPSARARGSGTRVAPGIVAAGLGLRNEAALDALVVTYASATGAMGARLVLALEAAARADRSLLEHGEHGDDGKDAGAGAASAALLVVRTGGAAAGAEPLVDVRVDQDAEPIAALATLYAKVSETLLPAAHVRFGDALRRRGDEEAAAKEYALAEAGFRSGVARAPKSGEALNELAWFLATRGGDPEEALRFAEAAVLARENDPNVLDTLAEAAYRAGNLERAIDAAERAARAAGGGAPYAERLRAFRAAKAALQPEANR